MLSKNDGKNRFWVLCCEKTRNANRNLKPLREFPCRGLPCRRNKITCRNLAFPASIHLHAASSRQCTGADSGRCASMPDMQRRRNPTSVTATCFNRDKPGFRWLLTCPPRLVMMQMIPWHWGKWARWVYRYPRYGIWKRFSAISRWTRFPPA